MPAIPTSETRLLIEVASDIDPIQTTDEVTLASGTSYEITPSGCARMRAAQGLAAPTWVTANPTTTTPRVHPWDVAHDFAAQNSSPIHPEFIALCSYRSGDKNGTRESDRLVQTIQPARS
jgi:hypothetical protein